MAPWLARRLLAERCNGGEALSSACCSRPPGRAASRPRTRWGDFCEFGRLVQCGRAPAHAGQQRLAFHDPLLRPMRRRPSSNLGCEHLPGCGVQCRSRRCGQRPNHLVPGPGRNSSGKARRLAQPGRCSTEQAFSENATVARNLAAEHAAYAELDGDGMFAPGQVGQGSLVTAAGSFGPLAAERTLCPTGP